MPSVSQTARFLSRYGDLLAVLALFPFVAHVKFAGMLQKADTNKEKEGDKDAKGKGGKKKQAPEPAAEDPGFLPPSWALLLILLSELLNAWAVFDPSDRQVQRAVGEVFRVQKASKGSGLKHTVIAIDRLLANQDVYALIRSLAGVCGCGSLLISALGGADRLPSAGTSSTRTFSIRRFLGNALRPRMLGMLVLLVVTAIGHSSALRFIGKKPGIAELAYALPALLRTVGLTGAAFTPSSDVLPTYAAINVCAAVAREAHVLVYERIKVPQLLAGGLFDVESKLLGPRSVMALELWSMLMLIPVAFKKRRFMLVLPLLALPCIWLACDGLLPKLVVTYFELVIGRIVFCNAVMSLLMVLLGGLPTMTIVVLLAQVVIRIHKLDTMKF